MQQDDEHARSKPAGTLDGSAAAPTSRAGGTRECRETLEAGAVGMARAHLAVMLARPLLEGAALYPAAMARLYLPYISPISPSTPRQWRASVWRKSKPSRPGPPEQALPSPEAGRGAGGLRLAVARGSPCLAASGASRCSGGAPGCWGRPSGGRTENLVETESKRRAGFSQPGHEAARGSPDDSRCLPQACLPAVAASLLAYALVLQTAGERSEDADDWRESSSASLLWDALTTDEPDAANDWGRRE